MSNKTTMKRAGVLAICLATAACQAQITKDLVVHLTFDNTYANSRGNGVDGTAVGQPKFVTGKIGAGAIAVTTLKDGSSFNYVTLGSPSQLIFGSVNDGTATDFSVSFWCSYTNQIDDPPFISNKDWMSSNNQGWGIFTQGGGNTRINVTDDTGSAGKQNTTSTPNIRDGQWHHMLVSFARRSVVSVYVDGQLKTTSDMTMVKGSIDTSFPVNIGQDGTGAYTDGGSAEMVDVLIDDLGIWRRVVSAGEVTAIYNAGLGGTNLANVPAIVDPYVKSTIPGAAATGVDPLSSVSAIITDGLNLVASNSIKMIINGTQVPVTISKVNADTTVVYTPTTPLASGENKASLIFGNNVTPQTMFTNNWTFLITTYITLTPDLKVTPDTTKPGFIWSIFANQGNTQNSSAKTEAALAGLLVDAGGNALPNLADPNAQGIASGPSTAPNPANAPIKFEIPGVLNVNAIGGSTAGNFTPDDQMPGVPATDSTTDGLAVEVTTYLELPAGLTKMGINSDDGFRTTTGKQPADQISSMLAGQFEGGRGPGDTTFYVNVQEAGVYAFRTTYENGTGGAALEWYTVKPDGTKVLVNDAANGGVKAYRAATTASGPFVRYVLPAPVPRQANQVSSSLTLVLSDGGTALDDSSIQLKLGGTVVTPTKKRQGSNVTLTYAPNTVLFPADLYQAELTFKDTTGTPTTDKWSFCSLKNVILPAPVAFDNFDSYTEFTLPPGWAQTNYTDTDAAGEDPNNLASDTYKPWVIVSRDLLNSLKSRIFNAVAPNQTSNGVPITVDNFTAGNVFYAESDVRNGSQVQFLYSKAYDLSNVTNAAIGFACLYEQNQDSLGAVEYSVDGGKSWLPVVYYLDFVDGGGDIVLNPDGTVDAVATFTNPNTDTASWTVNGVHYGGKYGDGIAAPITQALGRFVAPRANDDPVEGKRFEIYRLEQAGRKSDVRLRFAQLGTGSWYFGFDNLGFYDVPTPPPGQGTTPKVVLSISRGVGGALTLSWTGGGTLMECTSVNGTWTASASQANPQTVTPSGTAKFYVVGP